MGSFVSVSDYDYDSPVSSKEPCTQKLSDSICVLQNFYVLRTYIPGVYVGCSHRGCAYNVSHVGQIAIYSR